MITWRSLILDDTAQITWSRFYGVSLIFHSRKQVEEIVFGRSRSVRAKEPAASLDGWMDCRDRKVVEDAYVVVVVLGKMEGLS